MSPTRIDSTPARLSTNLSIDRQTPKRDFGDRMKAGLETAGGLLQNGASLAAGAFPGGAIISAAVSSVSQLGGHSTPGGGGATGNYQSLSSGVVNIGGSQGGIQTTVGGGGSGNPGMGMPGIGSTAGGQSNSLGSTGGASGGTTGQTNADLVASQGDNAKLLQLQVAMQRENQVFTCISNVHKTRHDTQKNSIGNVR